MPVTLSTMNVQAFNKSSVKIGHFVVKIAHGEKMDYTYEDKKTKQTVKAHKFECTLVGELPEVYMHGFVKGTPKDVDEAAKKFANGNVYTLSKTQLDTWTSPAYISSPKPFRVNLGKSTLTPMASSNDVAKKMPQAPVPPRTVAETAGITSSKSQDLLALVKEVANKRKNKDGKDIIDVVLIDGSKTQTGERATLFASVWGHDKVQLLESHVGHPLAFFNLTTKLDGDKRLVNHYEEAPIRSAPTCDKTDQLQIEAATLLAATDTKQLSSEREWTPAEGRDVSGPQPLCCAAFLDYTAAEPSASMPAVVQVPWLMIEEPDEEEQVTIGDGSRLWLLPKGRDASGSVRLGCPQRVALKLAQVENQADFERKQAEKSLGYPLFVHARISRTVKASSSQTSTTDFVAHTLEETQPVSWTKSEAPNASFKNVLAILNNLPPHDECIQFAFLKDLQEDPHYGFKIVYDGQPGVRAAYAAILVESIRATTTEPCGDGFKTETTGIRDIAALGLPGSNSDDLVEFEPGKACDLLATEPAFTIVGFSTLQGIIKLDPPRGKKSRFAVVLIDKFMDGTLEMQKAEFVEQDEAQGAVDCFRRLRKACKHIRPLATKKRTHTESANFVQSPENIKKCRTLRAMPTEGSLDDAAF